MLMGDDRAVATTVNETSAPKAKAPPRLCGDRQVESHPRCFLFGHYDSRGGASLVKGRNLIEAFQKYAESFGWELDKETGRLEDAAMRAHFKDDEKYEAWKPDSLHLLLDEDFMFSCDVVVCDEPFGEDSELDRTYSEDGGGYSYGVVQYRWRHKDWSSQGGEASPEMSKWTAHAANGVKKTLVFWKGRGKDRPTVDPQALGVLASALPGLEVRIVKKSYGEDSCGVCWLP